MRVTTVGNSSLRLLLEPETELELAFMKEMAAQSEKGATTILAAPLPSEKEFVLEVGGDK